MSRKGPKENVESKSARGFLKRKKASIRVIGGGGEGLIGGKMRSCRKKEGTVVWWNYGEGKD